MASQRRPTLNPLGMYLCHSFELRNEIWFHSMVHVLTLFGWEDMINFIVRHGIWPILLVKVSVLQNLQRDSVVLSCKIFQVSSASELSFKCQICGFCTA